MSVLVLFTNGLNSRKRGNSLRRSFRYGGGGGGGGLVWKKIDDHGSRI